MRDVFYTLLAVWVLWRIMSSVNTARNKKSSGGATASRKPGETTVDYVPPKKKSMGDNEGEYVDYEEVK